MWAARALSRQKKYLQRQNFFSSKLSKCFLKAYETSVLNLNFGYDQTIFSVHQQFSTLPTSASKCVLW